MEHSEVNFDKTRLEAWADKERAHPDNVQLRGDETFDGPVKNRKCTDVLFLLMFILANLGLIGVSYYIVDLGDPERLSHGYDFRAEVCGAGGLSDKEYMYYPDPTDLDFSLCVTTCPEYFVREYVCLYDTDHETLLLDWGCWDALESTEFGYYCVPVYDGREDVLDKLYEPMQSLRRSSGDIVLVRSKQSWDLPLVGVSLAIFIGGVYIAFFKHEKVMLVVISISLVVCGCLLGFIGYCFYLLSIRVSSMKTDDQLCGETNGIQPDYCDSSKSDIYLYFGFAIGAVVIVYIVTVIVFKRRFSVAIQLVMLACEPLHSLKHIYWFPLLQLVIGFTSIACVTTVLLWTMSTATIQKVSNDTIPGGETKQLIYTEREKYLLLLVVLVTSWWLSFLVALGESILAGAVAVWYFCREKSTLYSPLWSSLRTTFRYHLGSVAKGSLINLFLRYPRAILHFVRNLIRSKPRACLNRTAGCMCCSCLWCYEGFLKYYTDYTYIFISIFGEAYGLSARRSFFLILRNNRRITVPSAAGWYVVTVIKLTICLTGTAFTFGWLMNQNSTLQGQETDLLVSPIGPALYAFLVSSFVSQVFGGNIQACLDAVLLSGICDEEMFTRDQRFMEDRLSTFLDNICEEQTEQQKEDREVFLVQAPNASQRKVIKPETAYSDLPTADRYKDLTPRDPLYEPEILSTANSGRLQSGTQRANMFYGVKKLDSVEEEPDDSRPKFSR